MTNHYHVSLLAPRARKALPFLVPVYDWANVKAHFGQRVSTFLEPCPGLSCSAPRLAVPTAS